MDTIACMCDILKHHEPEFKFSNISM